MKMLLVLLFSLLLAGVAQAQITCTQVGQFMNCDGPRNQNSTQLDLGNGMGVITDSQGNVTPYTMLTPQTTRPSTVPAPQAPQPPRAPSFPTGGTSDLIQAPQAPAPIFAPVTLEGDAGR